MRVSRVVAAAFAGTIALTTSAVRADAGVEDTSADAAADTSTTTGAMDAGADTMPDADFGSEVAAYGCASAPAGSTALGTPAALLLALGVLRRRRGD